MWIVRLALRQPYTFAVAAILVLIFGAVSYRIMPQDIFPALDTPVVSVIWSYAGLPPQEMERRFATVSERAMSTTVRDIEHEESQSYSGVAVVKIFFQPGVKIDQALAQVTAISQTLLRQFPSGATPPLIVTDNAASAPILQLALTSPALSEAELYDQSLNFVRRPLTEVRGAILSLPYGGKQRLVSVDLDPRKCQALAISPLEVSNAIGEQNVVLPSGTVKIGDREYNVLLNSSPDLLAQLNNLPIKEVNGTTIFVHDVAQVRDGYAPQTSLANVNGDKAVLLSVRQGDSASTMQVIDGVRKKLAQLRAQLPAGLKIEPLFGQSSLIAAALRDVLIEGGLAIIVAAFLILLFLGSSRSALIAALSILLSLGCSLIVLAALGEGINLMTLGGLALALGLLVDDAVVTVENTDRHLRSGKRPFEAILDSTRQLKAPAFAAGFFFAPIFFLGGATSQLFSPLALAIILALLASCIVSRTIAPPLAHFLLREQPQETTDALPGKRQDIHRRFIRLFGWAQDRYAGFLKAALAAPGLVLWSAALFVILSLAIFTPFLGRDFFPQIDDGQFRLHVRAPSGTRIEETERGFAQAESLIREVIPAPELGVVVDNIGLPVGANLVSTDTIGAFDGEILVSLKSHHKPTADYMRELRHRLHYQMPEYVFFTQPSNPIDQALDFGLPAPLDIQITGPTANEKTDYALALRLIDRLRDVRGAVDVHLRQVVSAPSLFVDVDRTRASQIGLTQRDVANDLLISLTSSGQVAPNSWLNPVTGVSYSVAVQTPQYDIDSLDALRQTPISAGKLAQPQSLGNLAPITRVESPAVISHYDVAPVYDIFLNVQGRDLGGVADDVQKIVDPYRVSANTPGLALPSGSQIHVRGQVEEMNRAYDKLGVGILCALALIYLLLVIRFQSWLDPLIVLLALPGALAGVVWTLFLTNTSLSLPAVMGALMCLGLAIANGILVVSCANEERSRGCSSHDAALAAGFVRLRPLLMTAPTVILALLPMALGGTGSSYAPLARAVIGGLLVATLLTLVVVPVLYCVLRRRNISTLGKNLPVSGRKGYDGSLLAPADEP